MLVTRKRRRQPTGRQSEYLDFIRKYSQLHKRPPSEAEIAQYLGVSAPAVHRMVLALEAQGLLARTPGATRSLQVLLDQQEMTSGRDLIEAPRSSNCGKAEDTAILEAGISIAVEILRRLFAHVDRFPIDDAEFAPLVKSLLEGFECGLRSAGVTETAAAEARARLLNEAITMYTAWCARNDPEEADVNTDRRTFLYLMKHGRWPARR